MCVCVGQWDTPKVEVSSRSQCHTIQEEADDQTNNDVGVTGTPGSRGLCESSRHMSWYAHCLAVLRTRAFSQETPGANSGAMMSISNSQIVQ